TPESLYVLLGSESGRTMLKSTRTVIIDEIHALAANKRGSHLALSLERLAALTEKPPVRIGLSATQKPIEEMARYLVGVPSCHPEATPRDLLLDTNTEKQVLRGACPERARRAQDDKERACAIVDSGHIRPRDLEIEVPGSPLSAVMSHEVWEQVYARLAELVQSHRTTLI